VGILPLAEALQYAESQGVDLVEVAPDAVPPVCRVMDFGKYKYELQKKQQDGRKKQTSIQLKEIKFRPKTDEHDFQTKLKHIRRFLSAGDKCKVTVAFRGREMMHKDRGENMLKKVLEVLGETVKVDQPPSTEGRTIHMVLSNVEKKK
jgi:translation initiation factor IF-3